jgi:hypothetical protein
MVLFSTRGARDIYKTGILPLANLVTKKNLSKIKILSYEKSSNIRFKISEYQEIRLTEVYYMSNIWKSSKWWLRFAKYDL